MQASDSAGEAPVPHTGDGPQLSDSEVRFQRIMKIVVGVLGFLVVAALVAVVLGIIYLASGPATQPAPETEPATATEPRAGTQPAVPTPAIRPSQRLRLPPGATVRSVALSADRLAVHYDVGGKAGVAILDLKTGRTITNVEIEDGAVENK